MTTGIVLWVRIGNLVSNPYGDGERGSDNQEDRKGGAGGRVHRVGKHYIHS